MLKRIKTSPVTARRVKADIDYKPDQIVSATMDALKHLFGNYIKKENVHLKGYRNYHTFLAIVANNKGKEFVAAMKKLDYSVLAMAASAVAAATRLETDGSRTYVHYCPLNGVLTITSSLPLDI